MISAIRSCVASAVVLNLNLLNLAESEIAARLWLLCGTWAHISPYRIVSSFSLGSNVKHQARPQTVYCINSSGFPIVSAHILRSEIFQCVLKRKKGMTLGQTLTISQWSDTLVHKLHLNTCKFVPTISKQTKLVTFFPFVLSFYAILNPKGCLNLKQAWNPNPSSRLNSESSSPCKCCDNRGPCAISMLATSSAIRQTRQQELGAGDIEKGPVFPFFFPEDRSVRIRMREINVSVS